MQACSLHAAAGIQSMLSRPAASEGRTGSTRPKTHPCTQSRCRCNRCQATVDSNWCALATRCTRVVVLGVSPKLPSCPASCRWQARPRCNEVKARASCLHVGPGTQTALCCEATGPAKSDLHCAQQGSVHICLACNDACQGPVTRLAD